MKKSFLKPLIFAALALFTFSSCSDDNDTIPQTEPTYDMTGFAKGADVSWLTQMEASGKKFYNAKGTEQDCMALLRDLGVNSIRLRVSGRPLRWMVQQERCAVKGMACQEFGSAYNG